jgi:hypothetical protein
MIIDDLASKNPGGVAISELHAITTADVDGDGMTDVIAGKRLFSHLDSYTDPDPHGDAVLYVFRTVRDKRAPGGASFVPQLVHNRSGVGSMVQTADLNKDGAIDILTATNRGRSCSGARRRKGRARNDEDVKVLVVADGVTHVRVTDAQIAEDLAASANCCLLNTATVLAEQPRTGTSSVAITRPTRS